MRPIPKPRSQEIGVVHSLISSCVVNLVAVELVAPFPLFTCRSLNMRLILCFYIFCQRKVHAFASSSAVRPSRTAIVFLNQASANHDTLIGVSRRRLVFSFLSLCGIESSLLPRVAFAATSKAPSTSDPVDALVASRETLQKLLDNWEKAVIDCTFADVPRELLEQKNKEELLEKASTFALFDKSVSVETCKTTNRVVRDYLGATGTSPFHLSSRKKFYTDFSCDKVLDRWWD